MRTASGPLGPRASVLLAAGFVLLSGPLGLAQRFSEWSAPVNLGSIINSSAFDG